MKLLKYTAHSKWIAKIKIQHILQVKKIEYSLKLKRPLKTASFNAHQTVYRTVQNKCERIVYHDFHKLHTLNELYNPYVNEANYP